MNRGPTILHFVLCLFSNLCFENSPELLQFQFPTQLYLSCIDSQCKSDAFLDKSYRTTFKTKTKKRKRDIFFYVYLLFLVYARLVVLNWFRVYQTKISYLLDIFLHTKCIIHRFYSFAPARGSYNLYSYIVFLFSIEWLKVCHITS